MPNIIILLLIATLIFGLGLLVFEKIRNKSPLKAFKYGNLVFLMLGLVLVGQGLEAQKNNDVTYYEGEVVQPGQRILAGALIAGLSLYFFVASFRESKSESVDVDNPT